MARQWLNPIGGSVIHEEGTEQYLIPIGGAVINEDQAAAPGGATPKGPFGLPFHGPFGGPI